MRLVSVGEITLDNYLAQKEIYIGGISLNFAVHAKRSGVDDVALISRVGRDDGQVILEKLQEEKINATYVQILEGKTASIDIQVLDNAERVFPEGSYQENVLADFVLSNEECDFIKKQDVVVTYFDARQGSHYEQLAELELTCKRVVDFGDWARRKTQLDLLVNELEHLDLAFISGTEETIEALLPYSEKCLIVVTLGAKGSVVLTKPSVLYQEARAVSKLVDTTGCGDAFQAAFSVCYFQTQDVQQALERGAIQAAKVLQNYGAL